MKPKGNGKNEEKNALRLRKIEKKAAMRGRKVVVSKPVD
jgi:hypothetical protein